MQRGKLLIITPDVPHPTQGASTVLFYHYVAALKRSGYSILNILLLDGTEAKKKALAEYSASVASDGDFRIVTATAERFIERQGGQFSLATKPLEGVLKEAALFQPDAVFCLDLLSAWVAQGVSSPAKVAWLGDLNFQTSWYHALCKAKENFRFVIRIPSAWRRSAQWKGVYQNVLKSFPHTVVSSHSSIRHLKALGIQSVYHPYPWPVLGPAGDPATPPSRPIPKFLFCGGLDALGSKSAFLFLIKKLHGRLKEQWGNQFQLLIAGRGQPPGWVLGAIAARPEMKFLGFVEDLDSVMAECHAMIVPIDIPVGNRSRIVTAMSKGWLTIAHRFVAEANPALVDGKTCLLADDAGQFAAKMKWAVDCPSGVSKIQRCAREAYQELFATENATRPMVEIVERLVRGGERD